VIWHLPQYSLASAVLVDVADVSGLRGVTPMAASTLVLAWAVAFSFLYGSSPRLARVYERALKYMVWGIVLCFGLVVARTGVDWGAAARGLFGFRIPAERNGVSGATVVLSGLSAAVGVNMLFLYPYSLLARGWGREHRRLARFDLVTGMLVPYTLATTLMVIATANTLSGSFSGKALAPIEAAQSLALVVGPTFGRVVFNLGVLGMALSTISLHMLCCGFVASELFGWSFGSWRYRLATLLPAPAVCAPLFWSQVALWVAVPTNVLCGFFLPLVYVGFVRLQRSREYLGADVPRGVGGRLWLGGLVVTTLVLGVFLGWYALTQGPGYLQRIF
jgi:Mn2+/Fe2+ NRAMP family transporter